MPRTARAAEGGVVYHVLNRGNDRKRIFRKEGDYAAFLKLMVEGLQRVDLAIFAYCVMPNHWHLVVRPAGDCDLAAFLAWVCTTHVRRYHRHYETTGTGHLYQGRFKSFPIQEDEHLLAVLRYVDANPLRAGLVEQAEHWRWSSLGKSASVEAKGLLFPWPLPRPENWREMVNRAQSAEQLKRLRTSVNRGRPFGSPYWTQATAERLGLEFTLRNRGRPRRSR